MGRPMRPSPTKPMRSMREPFPDPAALRKSSRARSSAHPGPASALIGASNSGTCCAMSAKAKAKAAAWPDQVFEVLRRAAIQQVGYVPDAGHSRLIERCREEASMAAVVLTTEEEGIALAAGAWLGGQRAALLMQSSGVGNCINMLSLVR